MRNDFKAKCMVKVCDILDSQKSTEKIRLFSNVFFTMMALGVVAACAIFEIPYNIVTEIIKEYKHKS